MFSFDSSLTSSIRWDGSPGGEFLREWLRIDSPLSRTLNHSPGRPHGPARFAALSETDAPPAWRADSPFLLFIGRNRSNTQTILIVSEKCVLTDEPIAMVSADRTIPSAIADVNRGRGTTDIPHS
jgi:hypothetical protein